MTVTVTSEDEEVTNSQLHLFYKVMSLISEHTGDSLEDTVANYKYMFLFDYVNVDGKEVRVSKSFSEIDRVGFTNFMDSVRKHAHNFHNIPY